MSSVARHDDLVRVAGFALDDATHRFDCRWGEPIALTPVEYRLLRRLMEQPGEYISQPELLEQVWGYPPDGGGESTVERYGDS